MRGVYERVKGSGVFWIHWYDQDGRRHRERAGTRGNAVLLYRKRKTEALQRKKLPELDRRREVSFDELADDALSYSRLHKITHQSDVWRMRRVRTAFGKIPAW